MKLSGKRALITGSSSGIGRGIAVTFAQHGASVVVNHPPIERQAEKAHSLVDEIASGGGNALAIQGDVSKESEVKDLISQANEFLGGIDILINNAGIASISMIEDLSSDLWDKTLGVHLRGTFLMTKYVLPQMYAQDYGKIINTASQLAYSGAPGLCHYTAAKGAIVSLTRSLALEIGERNINVNCVAPGATHTPMVEGLPEEVLDAVRQNIPKKRIATVEDIVPSYVFLASDESSHYQGQCLSPNGGDVFL
ncbi:MAG: SDR family NAD(P)-dependent oxidoreductase [Pseudomonadota bacterium]